MKDTILTVKRKKAELITLLICFILANLANFCSIIIYDTHFIEMFTSIGYVTIASIVLYGVWSFIRIISYMITILLSKRK